MITRWQIALKRGSNFKPLGFSARHTKRALGVALFALPVADRVVLFSAWSTNGNFEWNTKAGEYVTTDGCRLYFTGTTEHDLKAA